MKPVPLSMLAPALVALTGQPVPSYRILWNRVASGTIPAIRSPTGRYCVDPVEAARALGLDILKQAA